MRAPRRRPRSRCAATAPRRPRWPERGGRRRCCCRPIATATRRASGWRRRSSSCGDTAFGVDAARDDLVEARQALESVRKLEERRRDEHRAARLRDEERELTDVIEARAGARDGAGPAWAGGRVSVTEALARVSRDPERRSRRWRRRRRATTASQAFGTMLDAQLATDGSGRTTFGGGTSLGSRRRTTT